ncbi:MAG: YkgJ family cysteine cluster protein [Magnetospirillum sp.]|nr:YkgJ family cysteine cluster protein [Magnetospirillum sp.]
MAGIGYSDARRAAFDAAAAALTQGQGPVQATRAAIAATDTFFAMVSTALNLEAQLAAMACAAGCSWCCHQIVGITDAELALVAEAIAAKPAKARKAIFARAKAAMARGKGMDQRQWWAARIRCPLLEDDGLCGIHEARPLPCRAHNSADADACRRSFLGEPVRTPVLAAQQGIWANAQAGLAEALLQAGYQPRPLALAEAVLGLAKG